MARSTVVDGVWRTGACQAAGALHGGGRGEQHALHRLAAANACRVPSSVSSFLDPRRPSPVTLSLSPSPRHSPLAALGPPQRMERGCCCHRTRPASAPSAPSTPPRLLRCPPSTPLAPAAPAIRTCECHCESLRRLCLALARSTDAVAARALDLDLDGLCACAARAALAARRPKTPRGTRWSRAAVDAPRMIPAPARSHCSHCSRTAPSRTRPRALPV
jgi:hypothetical protein